MFKSIKKFISVIMVAVLILSLCPYADTNSYIANANTYDDIKVKINGKNIDFDVKPQLVNGRTLVPLRAIFEALGATVSWDDATQTVVSTRNFTSVILTINSNVMYVNGNIVILDTPATEIGGRTLVPVRAVSEAFGTQVEWDDPNQTVKITFEEDDSSTFKPGTQIQVAEPLNFAEYIDDANTKLKAGIDVMGLIKPDHSLWMWGNNSKKQVSSSYGESVHSPTFVMANVKNFEIGKNHTLVQTTNNDVYCIGYDGKYTNANYEALLKSIDSIASGYDHCLALSTDGKLYAWGSNSKGQISSSDVKQIDIPEIIETGVKKIYAFKDYSVILFNNGNLRLMGDISSFKSVSGNYVTAIGKGSVNTLDTPNVTDVFAWRDAVGFITAEASDEKTTFYMKGTDVKQRAQNILNGLDCEWSVDSRAWVEDGNLYSLSGTYYTYKEKKCILDDIASICESEDGTTMAILNDSSVWIWGSDKNGALGNGYDEKVAAETPIMLMEPLCPDVSYSGTSIVDMSIIEIDPGNESGFNECTITLEFKNNKGKLARPIGMLEVDIFEAYTTHSLIKGKHKFYISESNYKPDAAVVKIPYRYINTVKSGRAQIELKFTDIHSFVTAESYAVSGFRTGNEREYDY